MVECSICIKPTSSDNLLLSVDKSDLTCEDCVSDIAVDMTIKRGEFIEGEG